MSEIIEQVPAPTYTGLQLKGLELLGSGISPVVVATTLGITESAVSQWLAQKEFAEQVTARRFSSLQKHASRDAKWDEIEDKLLQKMDDLIPFMYKPMEVFRALQLANAAKRRGPSAPENTHIANTVVNLSIPVQILQRFTKNSDNQVIEVEGSVQEQQPKPSRQSLVTIDSNSLLALKASRNSGEIDDATPKLEGAAVATKNTG